ncbi:MAG TPA: hypothetical protein VHB73_07485 [Alphaproteobacteria bacterium]|nr:hypothetical protein [Alphaproteobacteria bacterium]
MPSLKKLMQVLAAGLVSLSVMSWLEDTCNSSSLCPFSSKPSSNARLAPSATESPVQERWNEQRDNSVQGRHSNEADEGDYGRGTTGRHAPYSGDTGRKPGRL